MITIASIYPREMPEYRTPFTKVLPMIGQYREKDGLLILQMKAGSIEKPALVESVSGNGRSSGISDVWGQPVYVGEDRGVVGTAYNGYRWEHEPPESIAKGAVHFWVGGYAVNDLQARPGIWIVSPDLTMEEQIVNMTKVQDSFYRQQVMMANSKALKGRIDDITDLERFCAKQLNLDPDWINADAGIMRKVVCQFCGFNIRLHVAKCPNCHEIIDQQMYNRLKEKVASASLPAPPPAQGQKQPQLAR
jgi:hypothetical protein